MAEPGRSTPSASGEEAAHRALWFALTPYALTGLCVGGLLKEQLPVDPSAREEHVLMRAIFVGFPVLVALAALDSAVTALRGARPGKRGVAWLAIVVALAYLGLVGVGISLAAWC